MTTSFTRYSLAEGVNLYVQPTQKFKTTVVYVYFHMPLRADTVTANALLPMVMSRASADYMTTAALSRHLDELYGASFGADVNRRGEVQSLVFRLEVAGEQHLSGESGLLERGMETLAGLILRPALEGDGFKADYFHQEVDNLRQVIEGLINDKRRWAMVRCTEEMCENEPFALNRLGRVEDLPAITPRSLLQHHQQMLVSAPVDVFLIGAVEPEAARTLVQRTLVLPSAGEHGREMPSTLIKRVADKEKPQVDDHLDVNQGVLVVGFRTGITLREEAEYFPMLVANGVLGAFPHSKLFQEVREKHSLAYYAYSAVETVKGVGFMYAGIEFENKEQCLQIMRQQLESVQTGDISEDDFQTTINTLVNEMLGSADSPGALADLAVDRVFSGREISIDDRVEAYRQVTREQVAAAARKFSVETIYFLNRVERGE